MYDQGVDDYFNTNHNYGSSLYNTGAYGYGYGETCPCHQPFNNWMWNRGYNGYSTARHAGGYANSDTIRESERKNDYETYERSLGATRNDDSPLWKTIKIDCFSAQMKRMGVNQTQSEIINTSSTSTIGGRMRTTTTTQRKNRKVKLNTDTRSMTSIKEMLEELDKKVALNESILAFVLLKLNSKKDDEQRCVGGNENTPYGCYSSEKLQNIENELLEKLKHQVERSESGTTNISVDKKFIKNWNKLYNSLGGDGMRYEAKPKCTCKLSTTEIRKEFQNYFKKCYGGDKTNKIQQSKKTSSIKKHTDPKNNNKKAEVANVATNSTKTPSKVKVAQTQKPALKTKELHSENNKKKTKATHAASKAKTTTRVTFKKQAVSINNHKTQTKYLPQEVCTRKLCNKNKPKVFMPSARNYRIYLDNCVYTPDSKQRR